MVGREANVAQALTPPTETGDELIPRVFAFESAVSKATLAPIMENHWRPGRIALITPTASHETFIWIRDKHPNVSLFVGRGFGRTPFGSPESDPTWRALTLAEGMEVAVLAAKPDEGGPVIVIPSIMSSAQTDAHALSPGDGVMAPRKLKMKAGMVVERGHFSRE